MNANDGAGEAVPPFSIDHVDHIVLRVRDLERSVAFYALLGGQRTPRRRDAATSLVLAGETRLTLVHDPAHKPPERGNLDHFNLSIRAGDIASVAEYLEAHGARVLRHWERESGSPTLRVLDPDENIVELRLKQSEAESA
jgi:catechol 2,3-dioxygenase-like lactoylglutathione lyase family enzyme